MTYFGSILDWKSLISLAFALVISIAIVPPVWAQERSFPNEMPDYEFFSNGKLKPVSFGTTKRSDVMELFGSDCAKGCDYDERFTVKFDYLSCDDCMTTTHVRDRAMCPLTEFMDTIEKVTLIPKSPIQFENVSASKFNVRSGGGIYLKNGSGGVSYETFGDEFGLSYSIKRGNTASLALSTPGPATMNGPLYSIDYKINIELETKIFSAPFSSCKRGNR